MNRTIVEYIATSESPLEVIAGQFIETSVVAQGKPVIFAHSNNELDPEVRIQA